MSVKVVVTNKKARFLYEIIETLEAGLVLQGTEVKSLRLGKGNLQDSYATIKDGEMFLFNMHISPYDQGNIYNHEPDRIRKLLLHKQEIKRLTGKVVERGMTLVPLKIYFKNGHTELVSPEAGTVVCFLSAEFEHEVMPAKKERASLTGWFRKRS